MTEQISLNLTIEELEIIDKYVELNNDTRQLFDKIRKAYPKSPVEAAYKRVFGAYPPTTPSVHNFDDNQWFAFQKGYSCGYGDGLENSNDFAITKEHFQEESERIGRNLKTSLQELSNGDVRPIDDVVKEAKKELVEKQSKTLTDVVYRWWDDVFTSHSDWDMETSIEDLIDQVEQWLPKEQSAAGSQNVDVELLVDGFNDCLKKIKSKLR